MENVMSVAAYLTEQYSSRYSSPIDEMKLHKLLYFAQRESFVQNDCPLFDATFYGWKYGPVLKDIRAAYSCGAFDFSQGSNISEQAKTIVNKVLDEYAARDSWSLSRLTHGEISWKNSREGVPTEANSDYPMKNQDIQTDAQRIAARRKILTELGF